jgi:lysophospholipase L1-like esterase
MGTKIFFVALFIVSLVLMSYTKAGKKKKILFFGDSITEQGAKRGGYITQIDSIIKADVNNNNYDLVGAGVSGNKVYDLYLRMEEDVLAKSPDITVIYIGVNDVWHKSMLGTGTDVDKFEKFYRAIIRKLIAINSKIVLCTPAVIGERKDCSNEQDGDLNKYSNIIRHLAAEYSLPIVDLRTLFMNYYAEHNPENKEKGILTTDRVHLNPTGNVFVAEQMWKVLKEIK